MIKFNLRGAFKPKEGAKHPHYYICRYVDEQWYVKINAKLVPVYVPDIKTATVLYSLPSNDKHPHWTKKEVKPNTVTDIAAKYWCALCEGMKVKGYVEQNIFYITDYGK